MFSQGNNNNNDKMKQRRQRQQHLQQYEEGDERMTRDKVTKRILLINAEMDVSLALKLALEEKGREYRCDSFKVNCFNDPFLALKNFKNSFYDLVMLDIVIPDMNGFELSERIRKIDNNVKICFLTAGEVPSKLQFDPFIGKGSPPPPLPHHTVLYEDKFIRLPIENKELVSRVEGMIDS